MLNIRKYTISSYLSRFEICECIRLIFVKHTMFFLDLPLNLFKDNDVTVTLGIFYLFMCNQFAVFGGKTLFGAMPYSDYQSCSVIFGFLYLVVLHIFSNQYTYWTFFLSSIITCGFTYVKNICLVYWSKSFKR